MLRPRQQAGLQLQKLKHCLLQTAELAAHAWTYARKTILRPVVKQYFMLLAGSKASVLLQAMETLNALLVDGEEGPKEKGRGYHAN